MLFCYQNTVRKKNVLVLKKKKVLVLERERKIESKDRELADFLRSVKGQSRVSNKPAHTQDRPVLLRTFRALPWGTPRSIDLTPDLPRPPKRQGPRGGTPSLVQLKSRPTRPTFSGILRGPAPGHSEVYRVNPNLPGPPETSRTCLGVPGAGPHSGHTRSKQFLATECFFNFFLEVSQI